VEDGTDNEQTVWEITKADPIEVSAVLRGAAGPGRTHVASVKEAKSFKDELVSANTSVAAALKRAQDIKALRTDNGQEFPGPEAKEALADLLAGLEAAIKDLGALVVPDEDPEDVLNELRQLRELYA
jgi:hypothetical protein